MEVDVKKSLLSVILVAVINAWMFLIFSFYATDFDFTKWSEDARAFFCLVSVWFSVGSLALRGHVK